MISDSWQYKENLEDYSIFLVTNYSILSFLEPVLTEIGFVLASSLSFLPLAICMVLQATKRLKSEWALHGNKASLIVFIASKVN